MKKNEYLNSEKEIILSHRFSKYWIKNITIIVTIITNIILLIFIIKTSRNNSIFLYIIVLFYIIFTTMYDYFLMKSKMIKYDRKNIFIENGRNKEQISINNIIRIKRIFFFFCKLYYKSDKGQQKEVYWFISPNPSIKESFEIKLLKKIINESH